MPKWLEEKLKKEAIKKFPNDVEKQNAYVYGTMNKIEKHWYFKKVGRKK